MRMEKRMTVAVLCFTITLAAFSTAAFATDGMDLEGYGPIATGMGGASMAYDNGTAAMMNNPATLGLMPTGDRFDVALGYLGPHITASTPGAPDATSSANAFFMPAVGWATKSGALTYGFGVFSQGGMGTKYDGNSFLAAGSGEEVKSQLGVGRAMIPVAYNVNDKFTIGGSLDFVWASLDLKMAMSGAQFGNMLPGAPQTNGAASGSMVNKLMGAIGAGQLTDLNWARFDFNEDNPFEGAARSYGYAAKIGGVYKVSDALALGAMYQSETNLSDMEADGATVSMNVVGPSVGSATIPVTGKIKVVDFQWPQTVGLGAAYQATDKLMIVFDYKWINWETTMKNFKMTFSADSIQANPLAENFGLGGQSIDAVLFQNWKNQNVFMLGAGYKVTDEFTVRAGVNIANNPIPDQYMNPLFPAIEKDHYMIGAGYMFTKASSIDASFTYAPPVSATTQAQTGSAFAPGPTVPVTVSHYQTNAQVMYSYRF